MIPISEVTKRYNAVKDKNNNKRNNIHLLKEQCKRNSSNFNNFKLYIENWNIQTSNEITSFQNTLQFLEENCNNNMMNKSLRLIKENVIPTINDLNSCKKSLEKYSELYEECNKYNICDRVIENHYNLNEVINIDNLIKTTNIHEENIYDKILEVSDKIYNLNEGDCKLKYTLALENILYGLHKNNISYNRKTILEAVTDYFLFKNDDFKLNSINFVLENIKFYNDEDKSVLKYLNESINYRSIHESVDSIFKKLKKEVSLDNHQHVKSLVFRLYSQSPDNIIQEIPNFLSWIRHAVVFGTLAINPYLGIVNIIVDKFIEMDIKRKHIKEMKLDLKNEIRNVESKLDKAKSDTSIDRLGKYLETLNNNLDKITDYEDSLLSDKEKEDNDNIYEFAQLLQLEESMRDMNGIIEYDFENIIENTIELYNNDDIEALSKFVSENNILDKDSIIDILYNHRKNIYEKCKDNNKYKIGSVISECINKIECSKNNKSEINSFIENVEFLNAIINKQFKDNVIQETSHATNIKIAKEKLKKQYTKMSDKEKIISRQMDNALDKFYNKMQIELTNKNREAVIRGSIIPSFSAIMKLAITSGLIYFINPALSAITLIGGIAASKQGTKKEKQYILDELDIQLKIVEKKMQLAESNNDMKSLEQLMKIEQKLKREKQRIYYNIKRAYPNID